MFNYSGLFLVLKQAKSALWVEEPRFQFLVTAGEDSLDIVRVLPGWYKELTTSSQVPAVSLLVTSTLGMKFLPHLGAVTGCHFCKFLER